MNYGEVLPYNIKSPFHTIEEHFQFFNNDLQITSLSFRLVNVSYNY